jgi:hypothetical protein
MKRLTLLLCGLIITICFIGAPAQAAGFEFALGPKLDIGTGFYTGKEWRDTLDYFDRDNRAVFAFSIGVMFDMTFFRVGVFGLGFQNEVLFSLNGGGSTLDSDIFTEDRIMGIDIPLLIKPKFKLGNGDLYGLFGPVILIPVGDIHITNKVEGNTSEDDVAPHYDNGATAGIGVGIGYDITLGPGKLELGILYTAYLSRLYDHYDRFNNKFVFSVGYAFNVVKK